MAKQLNTDVLEATAAAVRRHSAAGPNGAIRAATELGVTVGCVYKRLRKLRNLKTLSNGAPANRERKRPEKPKPKPKPLMRNRKRRDATAIDADWAAKEKEHWARYVAGGRTDEVLRNSLVELQLVKLGRLAAKQSRAFAEQIPADDLLQEGFLAMIDCARRYDPTQDVTFWTFASRRCMGAMRDHARALDQVPRLTRTRQSERRRYENAFRAEHDRDPTAAEVQSALDWDENAYHDSFPTALVSADRPVYENDRGELTALRELLSALVDLPETNHAFEDEVRHLFAPLPMDDVCVLWLWAMRGATFKNLSVALGISESRVSQRMTVARGRLIERIVRDDFLVG